MLLLVVIELALVLVLLLVLLVLVYCIIIMLVNYYYHTFTLILTSYACTTLLEVRDYYTNDFHDDNINYIIVIDESRPVIANVNIYSSTSLFKIL